MLYVVTKTINKNKKRNSLDVNRGNFKNSVNSKRGYKRITGTQSR